MPRVKKPAPSTVASQFFEEDADANSARARRLARQQGTPVQVSQPVTPKKVVEDAKARRLKRQAVQPPKKPKADAPSPASASGNHVPEKGVAASWKKSWESCLEDGKWVLYADGKKVGELSGKGAGKI